MTDSDSPYTQLIQSTPEYARLTCHAKNPDFRQATHVIQTSFPSVLEPTEVVIRNKTVGINASDIYAWKEKPEGEFPLGFEAVGTIVATGSAVPDTFQIGTSVAHLGFGLYSDYSIVKIESGAVFPITDALNPSVLAVTICGLTASLALDLVGEMKPSGDKPLTVFISAAAGAVGNFAVQLAKLAGHHVIGTCSSSAKAEYLRSIGCDRAINYKEESIDQVLSSEYPRGLDLVFESVGGSIFQTCVEHVAIRGRIVVIGMISGYKDDQPQQHNTTSIFGQLKDKSASVRGFFLQHFASEFQKHIEKLITLMMSGQLVARVDPTPFVGLESVADALDFMYDRKNIGKVVVSLN